MTDWERVDIHVSEVKSRKNNPFQLHLGENPYVCQYKTEVLGCIINPK